MCGVYGIVSLRASYRPSRDLMTAMSETAVHRGPDDAGLHCDHRVALGMRRLSIIDLASGQQPIWNEDESVVLVCNGEIYNYRRVTEDLKARGHRFRTASDVEVIAHLYEDRGPDLVDELEGMFGLALWDQRRGRLILARDRMGVKPLYYAVDHEKLVFASEIKTILAAVGGASEPDPVALREYLTLGYTPNDRTIFPGIKKLPPASLLICEDGRIDIRRYWSPPRRIDDVQSEADWSEQIAQSIDAAVRSEMVSDVPLGAFLSGGIDSSCVVAAMARASDRPIKTYSIGFDTGQAGSYYNELPFARVVADHFGTDHKEIVVRPEVAQLLPKLIWHMDEPIADSALITTYLVAEFAREDVKVILSGVGGDEIFGGYRRYLGEFYGAKYARIPRGIRRSMIAPLARHLPSDRHSPLLNLTRQARIFLEAHEQPFAERYRAYVQVFGEGGLARLIPDLQNGHKDSLDAAFGYADGAAPLQKLMLVDLETQLPNDLLTLTDKMTMAASLECRVPLLNHRLVELAAGLPDQLRIRNGRLKHMLKAALENSLPKEILERKKRGFGAPIGAWLKTELVSLTDHLLSRRSIEQRGWFAWPEVERTLELHRSNRADHTDHLLCLLNLEVWARLFLDRRSVGDLADELADCA